MTSKRIFIRNFVELLAKHLPGIAFLYLSAVFIFLIGSSVQTESATVAFFAIAPFLLAIMLLTTGPTGLRSDSNGAQCSNKHKD